MLVITVTCNMLQMHSSYSYNLSPGFWAKLSLCKLDLQRLLQSLFGSWGFGTRVFVCLFGWGFLFFLTSVVLQSRESPSKFINRSIVTTGSLIYPVGFLCLIYTDTYLKNKIFSNIVSYGNCIFYKHICIYACRRCSMDSSQLTVHCAIAWSYQTASWWGDQKILAKTMFLFIS